MPPLLTYVIAAAIVALTMALIPLLGQLQRTAASAERFLDSAKDDVRRIQEDIHATRERIDALASSAQSAVDQLNGLARNMAELGAGFKHSVDGLMGRFSGGFNFAGILSAIGAIIALFRRPKAAEGEA